MATDSLTMTGGNVTPAANTADRATSTQCWISYEWEHQSGLASPGTWRRLMSADRSLFAMNRILGDLRRDQVGKANAEAFEVEFTGLAPSDVEAMMVACLELGARAAELLDEVRQNDHGCNATVRA